MKKMSVERRRIAGLASSLACMSGVMPSVLRHNPRGEWVWLAAYVPVMIWMVVRMVRLRRDEGCA